MSNEKLLELVKTKNSVCYLDDASSHSMANPGFMVETAHDLQIHKKVLDGVNNFCKENNINNAVKGIHIRATDWPWKQDCINSAYSTIQNLVDKNPSEKIFVCCDEEYIENDLITKLPENIIIHRKDSCVKKVVEGSWREKIDAGDGRTQDYNTFHDVDQCVDAFIDMLILSRTDIKYRHQHSSFSWFSEIYSNILELN